MFKRPIIIKARKRKQNFNMNFDYKTPVFFSFLICGVILGVFISEGGSVEWHSYITNTINNYLTFSENSFILFFIKIFTPLFLLYVLAYIIGLGGVGVPFLFTIPLALGCIFGIEVTNFYLNYGLKGISYCSLVFLPSYAIATATLIKCCCQCFNISGEIFIFLITGKGDNKPILKEYTLKYIVLLTPIVAGALLSGLLYKLFGSLFVF